MKLKRLVLFGYCDYYPGGGSNDILGTFDTYKELGNFLKNERMSVDEIDILDCKSQEITFRNVSFVYKKEKIKIMIERFLDGSIK